MSGETWNALSSFQQVGVPLAPWRVGDLGEHEAHALVRVVEAVVEGDRIERMAQVAQVRQQPDRTPGPLAGALGHGIPHTLVQRPVGRADEVRAAKPSRRRPPRRPAPERVEHPGQLGQVQIRHEERIAELVRHRDVAAMTDPALVDARVDHAASSTSSRSATGSATAPWSERQARVALQQPSS